MNISKTLTNVTTMLASFKLREGSPKLGKMDRGILEVAMMMAALDGEILDDEIAAFRTLAKKCRGYTAANAKQCLDEALRKGGYLMAIAKVSGYTAKQRIDAFVDLAVEAMPKGFVDGDFADLRRAFVLWVAMGVSDGDFSDIERHALDELQDRFAQVMRAQAQDEERRWAMLSPAFRVAYGTAAKARRVTLLEDGFIANAESLVRNLATASDRAKAEDALAEFIAQV